jgi:hypothetical protein
MRCRHLETHVDDSLYCPKHWRVDNECRYGRRSCKDYQSSKPTRINTINTIEEKANKDE